MSALRITVIARHKQAPSRLGSPVKSSPSLVPRVPSLQQARSQILLATLPDSLAQRPLLDHDRQDLIQGISSRHGRVLGIRVVRGCDLDDVRPDEVEPVQPAEDGPQLPRRPPSRLGRARRRREGRVQRVDVDAQVYGVLGADAVANLLDDPLDADGVDLSSLDDLETAGSGC